MSDALLAACRTMIGLDLEPELSDELGSPPPGSATPRPAVPGHPSGDAGSGTGPEHAVTWEPPRSPRPRAHHDRPGSTRPLARPRRRRRRPRADAVLRCGRLGTGQLQMRRSVRSHHGATLDVLARVICAHVLRTFRGSEECARSRSGRDDDPCEASWFDVACWTSRAPWTGTLGWAAGATQPARSAAP